MNTNYESTCLTIKELVGNEYLHFDEAIEIIGNGFTICRLWAVAVSPKNDIYVQDSEEQWCQVDHDDDAIINALWKKVNVIAIRQLQNSRA